MAVPAAALLASLVGGPAVAQTPPVDDSTTVRVGLSADGPSALVGDWVADPAIFGAAHLGRCCLARTLLAYPGLPLLEGGTVLHPDLAVGLPDVSSDGLLWSFELKPGIRYQPPYEDRTVAAQDIIRAIERAVRISPEMVGPGAPFENLDGAADYAAGTAPVIRGLESPDPLSLTFRLTQPDGAFGHYLTDPSTAPIPEGVADGFDPVFAEPSPSEGPQPDPPEVPFATRYVSSGPYMFEEYPADVSDGRVALVRNPSWEQSTDELRRPQPERIEVLTFASLDEAMEALDDGDVDFLGQPPDPDTVAAFQRDPELAGRLLQGTTEALAFIPMNLAMPPFDDVAVRRAVNAVVDRAALRDAHLDERVALPWLSGLRLTADVADHVFADHLSAGLLATYQPFPSAGDHGDVAAARDEMRASRYDSDGDGMCDAIECSGVVISADMPATAALLRDDLAEIGIEAEVVALTDELDMSFPGNRTAIQVNWYQWGYGLSGDVGPLLSGGSRSRTRAGSSINRCWARPPSSCRLGVTTSRTCHRWTGSWRPAGSRWVTAEQPAGRGSTRCCRR